MAVAPAPTVATQPSAVAGAPAPPGLDARVDLEAAIRDLLVVRSAPMFAGVPSGSRSDPPTPPPSFIGAPLSSKLPMPSAPPGLFSNPEKMEDQLKGHFGGQPTSTLTPEAQQLIQLRTMLAQCLHKKLEDGEHGDLTPPQSFMDPDLGFCNRFAMDKLAMDPAYIDVQGLTTPPAGVIDKTPYAHTSHLVAPFEGNDLWQHL